MALTIAPLAVPTILATRELRPRGDEAGGVEAARDVEPEVDDDAVKGGEEEGGDEVGGDPAEEAAAEEQLLAERGEQEGGADEGEDERLFGDREEATPALQPVVSMPTTPPATSSEAVIQQIELILAAFGKALEAVQVRQSREVLHVSLTAQQEHLALLMQAFADHRHEYGEQLERAVRRLSDELTSDSVTQIGELFHRSASEITGALARTERLSGRLLEKQNHIIDALGTLGDTTTRLLAVAVELRDLGSGIAGSLAELASSRAPAREPERRLQVVASRPDVLDTVREDLDRDDEP